MSNISLVVKPKYPTRRAVEYTLFDEGQLIDSFEIENEIQAIGLLDTAHVALYVDGVYYPLHNSAEIEEQYSLVKEGETPTVESEDGFGILKLNNFVSIPEEGMESIQRDVVKSGNNLYGILYQVSNYENLGNTDINANGYWVAFDFDMDAATTEGYSEIIIGNDEVEVKSGTNYIFLGNTKEAAELYDIRMNAKLTITEGEESETVDIDDGLKKYFIYSDSEDKASIEVDGKAFDGTIEEAFAAAKSNSTVTINKSCEMNSSIVIDKAINLDLYANITFAKSKAIFEVHNGGSLVIIGHKNGVSLTEAKPYYGSVVVKNDSAEGLATAYVENVELTGWCGAMFKNGNIGPAQITLVNCKINGLDHSSGGTGCGAYIHGQVKNASLIIDGCKIESSGTGVFQAGYSDTIVTNSEFICGETGTEVRAGNFNAYKSKFICTSEDETTMTPSGSGTTTISAGFAVAQHTTKRHIGIVLKECVLIGKSAFIEGNPQGNPKATEDTELTFINNTFKGTIKTNNPEEDCVEFLKDGLFSEKPEAIYVAKEYIAKKAGAKYEVIHESEDDKFFASLCLEKVEDYFYTAKCPVTNFGKANDYLKFSGKERSRMGCSSIQVGAFRGRNFDWYYNHNVVIHFTTPKEDGRHAVLATAGGIGSLTKEVLESGEFIEVFKHINAMALDGINDAGLVINTNMIGYQDIPITESSNPGKEDICNLMVAKYLLDYASTTDEAVDIMKTLNIWPDEVYGAPIELHWMITDASGKTVVAEIINGEVITTESDIMTNYLLGVPLQLHSDGIERYNILAEGKSSVSSAETMLDLMKQVWFTKAYDESTNPYWYSELNGVDQFGDLNINSKEEDYAEKKAAMIAQFTERSRDTGKTWQTVFTTVYDIENKTMMICNQEGTDTYTYSFEN